MKKNQCKHCFLIDSFNYYDNTDQKTQYSIPFLLSLKKKYEDKPMDMSEIKIPLKHEIRSRAKVLTDEAFRETRNYLDMNNNEIKNAHTKEIAGVYNQRKNVNKYKSDPKEMTSQIFLKTNELREQLNKVSHSNYTANLEQILKYNYDEELLENFKV